MRGCSRRSAPSLVKIGLRRRRQPSPAAHAIAAGAVHGARRRRSRGAGGVRRHAACRRVARRALGCSIAAGAAGVLLDTADKRGPRLTELVSLAWLTEWAARAHRRSLSVALAGRLRAEDLPIVRRSGADVAGVRGAACEGGRKDASWPRRCAACCRACTPPAISSRSHSHAVSAGHRARQRGARVRENPASQRLRPDARSRHRQLPPGGRADRGHEDRRRRAAAARSATPR